MTRTPRIYWQEDGGASHAWLLPTQEHPTSLCGRHEDGVTWEPAWPSKASCLGCHAGIRRLIQQHQGVSLVLPPIWPLSASQEVALRIEEPLGSRSA